MVAVLTYARQLGFCRSTPPTIPHSRNQLVNKTAGQAAVAESWADRVSPGAVTHATGAMCPTLGAHQFEPNQVRCTACLTRTLSCRIFRRSGVIAWLLLGPLCGPHCRQARGLRSPRG
nr:hypothetical protein [Mycobacterium tuberculosis]